jgi:gas vesicle structural protein
MAIERAQGGSSLVEVIDRILDKGIVIDAWVRVSLVGIELVTVEARVVIASVDTYLRYADAVSNTPQVARPKGVEAPGRYEELASELAGLRAQLAQPAKQSRPKAAARVRKPAVLAY